MYKKFIISLLASAVFFGCQKDSLPGGDIPGDNKVVFSGTSAGKGSTRTSLGDTDLATIPVYWSPGDGIGVFTSTVGAVANNAKASIVDGASTQNGKFSSLSITMAQTANVFYLYYPYANGANIPGDPDEKIPIRFHAGDQPYITGFLAAEQSQNSAGTYDQFGKYGFSVAVSDPANKNSEVNFSMKHILSYLELSLWSTDAELTGYDIEQIEVETSGQKYITGIFKSDFNGNYEELVGNNIQFGKKITISVAEPGNIEQGAANAQKYIAAMLPVDLTGEQITISVRAKENSGGSPRIRVYTKSFNGVDFSGSILKKVTEDISQWNYTISLQSVMATFVSRMGKLEYWADKWFVETAPVTEAVANGKLYNGKYPQWLMAAHIRQYGGYTSSTWNTTGGIIKADFTTYLQANDTETLNYFRLITAIPGLDDGMFPGFNFATRTIDVRHMFATMSAVLYSSTGTLDDLSGWGGDLVTLVINMLRSKDTSGGAGDTEFYKSLTKQYLARPNTTYDMDDLLGDIDAINIPAVIKEQDTDIYNAMLYYYTSSEGYKKRFTHFLNFFGTEEDAFYKKTLVYTTGTSLFVNILYTNNGFDVSTLTVPQKTGIAQGYCEFILSLAALE